jgi:hypothetical protein
VGVFRKSRMSPEQLQRFCDPTHMDPSGHLDVLRRTNLMCWAVRESEPMGFAFARWLGADVGTHLHNPAPAPEIPATTRAEHLAWCKERALEYLNRGRINDALTSFASDMTKHTGTLGHPGFLLMALLVESGRLRTCKEVRKFIEGFN